MSRAVFLFAGPGGACLGAKAVGITGPGIELDAAVCQTRRAAGLETVEGSVTGYGPADFSDAVGLWGSPPCQLFSTAGKGAARKMMPEILEAIAAMGRGEKPDTSGWPDGAMLVLEPLRWAIEAINLGRPYEWIALEQVPPVLPVWEAVADVLRHGYGVATGNLQAECFGVPQTRKRAVLVARLDGSAHLPAPTHSRYYPRDPQRLDPGVLPWISMAQALGWSADVEVISNYGTGGDPANRGVRTGEQPAATVTPKIDRNVVYRSDNRPNSAVRDPAKPAPTILGNGERGTHAKWVTFAGAGRTAVDTAGQIPRDPAKPAHTITGKGTASWTRVRPATTVNGDARIAQPGRDDPAVSGSQYGAETVRVSVQEAAILQSFPADYPWTGDPAKPNSRTSQYQMVGNAIPPLLAEAVLRAVTEVR